MPCNYKKMIQNLIPDVELQSQVSNTGSSACLCGSPKHTDVVSKNFSYLCCVKTKISA